MNRTLLKTETISGGLFSLILLLAHASAVQNPSPIPTATTYYVDSAEGNDDNAGATPATAWKSLAKVNATTSLPGERILLKSGSVWKGQLWPKGSGVKGHPIVVKLSGYHLLPGSPARGTGKFVERKGGQHVWGRTVPSCGKTDRGASQSNHCNGASK